MSKPDKTILPRILDVALNEFKTNGFEKTSTNKICKEVGVTTGALFKRFANKDELFKALVGDTANEFKDKLIEIQTSFHNQDSTIKQKNAIRKDDDPHIFLGYIYEHYDAFYLLLNCSKGSSYENYMNELVDILIDSTFKYFIDENININILDSKITYDTVYILISSYLYALFKPVTMNMNYEDAVTYCKQIKFFFDSGWSSLLNS